jgi:hypothetical protein
VLDAIWRDDPEMRRQFEQWTGMVADATQDPYSSLPAIEINGVAEDVREGTAAMTAYQEIMYGACKRDPKARGKWAALLKQYCKLDTLSMVLIFEHWKRLTGLA